MPEEGIFGASSALAGLQNFPAPEGGTTHRPWLATPGCSPTVPAAAQVVLFGGTLWSMLAVVGGSVAHVSPTFVFQELIVRHSFGQQRELARSIALSLFRQGAAQGYKVVGSMEMLGDPVTLVAGIGGGVYQFFRKTGADLLGESETTGEGLKDLLQGVVGGTFGSVAKITGAADDLLSKIGGTEGAGAAGSHFVRTKDGRLAARPRPSHVGEGLVQGGERVWRGVTEGLAGLVVKPLQGAAADGVGGFFVGLGRGAVGAVAAPVAGVLGGLSTLSLSVDANLKLWDRRPMGHRRDPRPQQPGRPLVPLSAAGLAANVPAAAAPPPPQLPPQPQPLQLQAARRRAVGRTESAGEAPAT